MLRARAPAKVNLTLHVLGRRADGFHELDSLVAFAGCAADSLTLAPGADLAIDVSGPFADGAGPEAENLVIKAANAFGARARSAVLGRFSLVKRTPVAAGLGGGSADAAAALRLLAQVNGVALNDPRLVEAAAAIGSDVAVCLASRAAMMRGRGERVTPVAMAPLAAVLANPMRPVPTSIVYRGLGLQPGEMRASNPSPEPGADPIPAIAAGRNDLEPPALAHEPAIGEALALMGALENCRLARMSGSGGTVFGLFSDLRSARTAARALRAARPGWWIMPTTLR
ncbi:4-(cytidine 5'-diphospho)-2-C-methyl-D-erythritol kinase [Hansschlegelia quercus]|uniref:4-diphosphocytidyl-2-C-methyl-D-erythritol kinase n=1 Tax=Hansschlegelia quercus TaxID=2528245 RepID=A0A4Q9GLP7_9HYPH|nr:4-(cytidine 5'-diphospho)-2-C-methyl-D-erythritol kinase [Hansschlegelia quercus]TBN55172.1 4-(cytidine 5'-diphospho)-2-C-methyl-D-erythritol kinase [Hansschlegelia quercus]